MSIFGIQIHQNIPEIKEYFFYLYLYLPGNKTLPCWGIFPHTDEPLHDKTNKMTVRPAKTQISLGIRPVWTESSLSTWRKLGFLATHWAHSEDSDQTGPMPRLIWVFAGPTVILLVLSWGGSNVIFVGVSRRDWWVFCWRCSPWWRVHPVQICSPRHPGELWFPPPARSNQHSVIKVGIRPAINWAPSSEFVSSSIPSWQTLTAHAQPFRGARDLAFCLKVPLDSLLVWASSGGSGETARMRRLAWTFAARIGDKYQICLSRSN